MNSIGVIKCNSIIYHFKFLQIELSSVEIIIIKRTNNNNMLLLLLSL